MGMDVGDRRLPAGGAAAGRREDHLRPDRAAEACGRFPRRLSRQAPAQYSYWFNDITAAASAASTRARGRSNAAPDLALDLSHFARSVAEVYCLTRATEARIY